MTANLRIQSYGALPYSSEEYASLFGSRKNEKARKLLNFAKLKKEINSKMPHQLFHIKEDELFLNFVYEAKLRERGEGISSGMFEPSGQRELKSEAAFIICHILFVHPRIGLSAFNDLFACMHVLIKGRAPTEREIASASTIRLNVQRLNSLDLEEIKSNLPP